jgi:hypothetical protein
MKVVGKLSLVVMLTFVLNAAQAQPRKFRTMFRDDPSSSIVIGWSQMITLSNNGTNFKLFYSKVDHGQDTVAYKQDNASVSPAKVVENFKLMDHYFVRLTNLEPNTAYYFVVSYQTPSLTGVGEVPGVSNMELSERYWSTTMPDNPNEPLSIISGGDSREDLENPDQTVQSITIRREANKMVAKLNPHVVFFGGDYTFASDDNEWMNWLNDWELTYSETNKITPIIAAAGNHEYAPFGGAQAGSQILTSIFDVPQDDVYYALTFGGSLLRLYTLNTEVAISGDQSDWLLSDLAATDTMVHWKMAQYHKPIRPHEAGKSDQNAAYTEWAQSFYDFQVRLVFESDAHVVKTTHPLMPTTLDNGENNEEGYEADMNFVRTENRGTVYVGEGTWAALRDGNDAKVWTRAMGGFNQVKWIWVTKDTIEVRTVITFDPNDEEYVNNIPALDGNTRFTEPAELQVWSPASGKVVFITNNGLSSRSFNQAPLLEIPNVNLFEDDGLVVVCDLLDYANDPNNDILSFTIVSQSNETVVNCQITGSVLEATTASNQFGVSTVVIAATDGEETVNDTIQVVVNEVNNMPLITVPDVELLENVGVVNLFDLIDYASDVDQDDITFNIVSQSSPTIVSCSLTGTELYAATISNQIGVSEVVISVYDGRLTAYDTIQVSVLADVTSDISNQIILNVLSIAPNPVINGAITILVNDAPGVGTVTMFDLNSGKKVYEERRYLKNKIVVRPSFITKGIYYINITIGSKQYGQKLIWM